MAKRTRQQILESLSPQERFVSEAVFARRQELGSGQELGPTSRQELSKIETSGLLPKQAGTRRRLAETLKWPSDACDQLDRGDIPTGSDSTHWTEQARQELAEKEAQLSQMQRDVRELRKVLDRFGPSPDPGDPSPAK